MCWCRLTAEEFPQGLPPRALPHLPQDPSAAGRAGCGQSQAAFRARPLPGPPVSPGTVRLLAPPWVPRPPAARRARPRAHLAYGAHGAHVALVPGAELGRREQPRGVEAVEASVDGDLTDRPQVTVAPDLEFGGVLVGNPGGEQGRVCVETCSTEEAGAGQVPTATASLHTSASDTGALPRSTLPRGVCKESFGGKSLRAITVPSAHEIMSSITFS